MWHTSTLLPSAGSCDCYLCRSTSKPSLSAYLAPPPARAPLENAYYIVAVSGGTVLSKRPAGILNCDAANSDSQRWRVEYSGEGNLVAFRNVADGGWLRASTGSAYGYVDTSEEKQWWVMEEGASPGSCWIKCEEFADAYLCNANGSFVDGNAAYTRPKQSDRAHAQTWTLRDADAVGYDAKGWRLSVSPDGDDGRDGEELVEREAAVEEREARMQTFEEELVARQDVQTRRNEELAVTKSTQEKQARDLATREATLERQTQKLTVGEATQERQAKDLSTREAALAKQAEDFTTKEARLRKQADDLAMKEAALRRQADDFASKEAELKRPSSSGSGSGGNHSDRIALLKAENDHLHLQLRTSSLEREVEKVRQRSTSTSNTEHLRSLEVEKARLRVLLHAEQQKARTSPSPKKPNASPSLFNSPSSLATRPSKDPRTTLFGQTSRPGSSSGSVFRPSTAVPSSIATPKSSLRNSDGYSASTPTRASTGVMSSGSGTQRSYDSKFSGWPEDDFDMPSTPTRSSKRASSSTMGSTPQANTSHTKLSRENLNISILNRQRAVSEKTQSTGPRSTASHVPSVPSSAGGKATSKSTPARTGTPRMATLRYGAPDGMVPLSDDGDAVLYPCGHKVYKPPRKLNKNVVGYMYE